MIEQLNFEFNSGNEQVNTEPSDKQDYDKRKIRKMSDYPPKVAYDPNKEPSEAARDQGWGWGYDYRLRHGNENPNSGGPKDSTPKQHPWELSDEDKRIGLRGIEKAREALENAKKQSEAVE